MGRHKEWRKIAKKENRRKKRVHKATLMQQLLDKEEKAKQSLPGYAQWVREHQAFEIFQRQEIERQNEIENEKWLRAEKNAAVKWKELREKIERAQLQRLEQELKIRKEWEEEQEKVKEAKRKIQDMEEENKKKQDIFIEKLEQFLVGDSRDPPEELLVSHVTRNNAEPCPFFSKTGCCRFGDSCSRNHVYPGISNVLLAPNLFSQYGMDNASHLDLDLLLEYEDSETYSLFKEFYNDVLPEFEKWGQVTQFKVCSNTERHLRGNMYVQYANARDAVAAYRALHARFYAGRPLHLLFVNIACWESAVCGMSGSKRCPKGRACNFLHTFRNPDNRFERHREHSRRHRGRDNGGRNLSKNWRWSESPEPETKRHRSRSRSARKRAERSWSRDVSERRQSHSKERKENDKKSYSHRTKGEREETKSDRSKGKNVDKTKEDSSSRNSSDKAIDDKRTKVDEKESDHRTYKRLRKRSRRRSSSRGS